MKIKFCITCIVVLIQLNLFAQSSNDSFGDHLVIGGGLGMQFGEVTLIEVAPTVGYLLTDNWLAGIGGKYVYLHDKYFDYKTNIYGGSIFTQYYFLNSFVAHSEVELLNLEVFDSFLEQKAERKTITSVLVGGGLRIPAGGSTYILLMALWNLNQSIYSPYANPVIRAGFGVGF